MAFELEKLFVDVFAPVSGDMDEAIISVAGWPQGLYLG